jgi:hypothetical protein
MSCAYNDIVINKIFIQKIFFGLSKLAMSSQNRDIEYSKYSRYLKNKFADWTSGNERIDAFIQEVQLKIYNSNNTVLEWIPYSQFNNIKEMGKNGSITIYSAIWRDGPLHWIWYGIDSNYTRNSNKKVTLKFLHNSKDPAEFVINEVKYF